VVDVVAEFPAPDSLTETKMMKMGELTATASSHDEALLDLDSLIKELA
jgi:hypothetical protein